MEGGTVYDLQVLDESKKEETKSSGSFTEYKFVIISDIYLIRSCWWRWY